MNTDSNKVLLLGMGETGLDVVRIIEENGIKGIAGFGIKNESELQQLADNVLEKAELMLLVADLGDKKENSLALKAAALAKGKGKVVAAFLATPPLFEGEKAVMGALEAARKISREVDSFLIINKETFNALPKEECSFAELIDSLVAVEETIADGIHNIMALISEEGGIKIDVQDLKTALAESGTFTVERGLGAGEKRLALAIEQSISSPLMKICDISGAHRVLIKVLVPKDIPLTIDKMKGMAEFIETLPSHTEVKWGVGESDDDNILSVILLASGYDVKLPK